MPIGLRPAGRPPPGQPAPGPPRPTLRPGPCRRPPGWWRRCRYSAPGRLRNACSWRAFWTSMLARLRPVLNTSQRTEGPNDQARLRGSNRRPELVACQPIEPLSVIFGKRSAVATPIRAGCHWRLVRQCLPSRAGCHSERAKRVEESRRGRMPFVRYGPACRQAGCSSTRGPHLVRRMLAPPRGPAPATSRPRASPPRRCRARNLPPPRGRGLSAEIPAFDR